MSEDDFVGWKLLTDQIGGRVQLVGDDLFVTNPKRLAMGIKDGLANSLLVKVNQIGTLTETLEAVEMAHRARYTTVMSHRSGKPKIQLSPTSRLPPIAGRSRPAASRVPTAWPNITSLFGLRSNWGRLRNMLAAASFIQKSLDPLNHI